MSRAYTFIKTRLGYENDVMKRLKEIAEVKRADFIRSVAPWDIAVTLQGPYQEVGRAHVQICGLPEVADSQTYYAIPKT